MRPVNWQLRCPLANLFSSSPSYRRVPSSPLRGSVYLGTESLFNGNRIVCSGDHVSQRSILICNFDFSYFEKAMRFNVSLIKGTNTQIIISSGQSKCSLRNFDALKLNVYISNDAERDLLKNDLFKLQSERQSISVIHLNSY